MGDWRNGSLGNAEHGGAPSVAEDVVNADGWEGVLHQKNRCDGINKCCKQDKKMSRKDAKPQRADKSMESLVISIK